MRAQRCQRLLSAFPPDVWYHPNLAGRYGDLVDKADELADEGVELGIYGLFRLDPEGRRIIAFDPTNGKRSGSIESFRTGHWDQDYVDYGTD